MKDIVIEPKKYGARKSQREWAEINALWEKNPKRLKVFCSELEINYTSFAYWRGRLKKEKRMNLPVASHGVSEEAQLLFFRILSLILHILCNNIPVPSLSYRRRVIAI